MSEGNIENPQGLNEVIRDKSVTHQRFSVATEKISPSISAYNEQVSYGLAALAGKVQKIERRLRRIIHPLQKKK